MLRAVSSPSSEDDLQADQVLSAGGSYKQRELKRIARRMRRSVLGPTSVYYAGVTAPAIAAGMATVCSAAFSRAGWDPYWVLMASAIMASMAGISWYLIFMRLAYRHGFGRGIGHGLASGHGQGLSHGFGHGLGNGPWQKRL